MFFCVLENHLTTIPPHIATPHEIGCRSVGLLVSSASAKTDGRKLLLLANVALTVPVVFMYSIIIKAALQVTTVRS